MPRRYHAVLSQRFVQKLDERGDFAEDAEQCGIEASGRRGSWRQLAAGQKLSMLEVHAAVLEACVRADEADLDNSAVIREVRRRGKN